MQLKTICAGCGSDLTTRTRARDRVELARRQGEFIPLTCHECHLTHNYHVDSLSAQPGKIAQAVAVTVLSAGTIAVAVILVKLVAFKGDAFFLIQTAALLLLPVSIYMIILKENRKKVSGFNRHKFKGYNSIIDYGYEKNNDT